MAADFSHPMAPFDMVADACWFEFSRSMCSALGKLPPQRPRLRLCQWSLVSSTTLSRENSDPPKVAEFTNALKLLSLNLNLCRLGLDVFETSERARAKA